MANDVTPLVLDVINNSLPAMRRSMALSARIYNHNRNGFDGRGSSRWTKWTAASVETKTEGTQLTDSIGDITVGKVVLEPETHKVARIRLEDGEMSRTQGGIKSLLMQQVPRNLIALVNTIETAIAAKQSSLTTNRIGVLGNGLDKSLLAKAIRMLEEQEGRPDTLCVSPYTKEGIMTDEETMKLFMYLQSGNASVGQFVPNALGFGAVGVSNQIYTPDTGQYVALAFQRECLGIAFGDLTGVDEGAGRFIKSITDPDTGITFRVVQGASHDLHGQVISIDVQYDIEVQQEEIGVAILC
jgi:hypothetical protein